MSNTVKLIAILAMLAVLAALVVAAANSQTHSKPSNVTATATDEGYILVNWDDDAAPVHRVGWAHDGDAREAQDAGDWLEAFHFADTKRNTDYTVKYLPPGQQYWFIVGAANERFAGATWSDWASLTTPADSPTEPSPTPEPTPSPTPQSTPTPRPTTCSGDDYNRDEWGTYPAADSNATPKWTLPSDDVSSRDITQDHHVALKDAHVSGGCDWSASRKDQFSSDADNLNPTTRSFNSSKANRTPDQLTGIAKRIINTNGEKCDYATQHKDVKDEYGLTMTTAERSTVNEWLASCP